jgi:hypothetical protein
LRRTFSLWQFMKEVDEKCEFVGVPMREIDGEQRIEENKQVTERRMIEENKKSALSNLSP